MICTILVVAGCIAGLIVLAAVIRHIATKNAMKVFNEQTKDLFKR